MNTKLRDLIDQVKALRVGKDIPEEWLDQAAAVASDEDLGTDDHSQLKRLGAMSIILAHQVKLLTDCIVDLTEILAEIDPRVQ